VEILGVLNMINIEYQYYPKNDDTLYYIEYSKWEDSDCWDWSLFKRNYFIFNDVKHNAHPYNLGCGKVIENNNCIAMNTRKFLEYMVDALNEKSKK
jgi:hypothetical protein